MKTHRSILARVVGLDRALLRGRRRANATCPGGPPSCGGGAGERRAARGASGARLRCGRTRVTAPYPISVTWNKRAVVLSGRVGTKAVHDVAVQLAIAARIADSR